MAARTVSTTELQEDALKYLASENKQEPDDYLMDKLSVMFTEIVQEANQKRYAAAQKILETKDAAKIIPALRDLLK